MTQDEIIEMARQAGLVEPEGIFITWDATQTQLEAFAKLVAAKEREACAKTAEDKGLTWKSREDIEPDNAKRAYMASQFIAQAIRARGEA